MTNTKHSKHQNQVRIIGGKYRGRKLTFASAEGLRPTPDSVRERLFNWLGQDLTGMSVLDLFAGSGALGFEAASRNAARVLMLDNDKQTVDNLQRHTDLADWRIQVEVKCQPAQNFLQNNQEKFDVVMLDPPFDWKQWPQLFPLLQGSLQDGAWVYIEAGEPPVLPPYLGAYREGRAGKSRFSLLRYSAQNNETYL